MDAQSDDEHLYGDDPEHPIPQIFAIDIEGELKSGGADLFIVIASPLQADERSQRRLLKKIEVYLAYLNSREYALAHAVPNPSTTTIFVSMHPESDSVSFDLVSRCKDWVMENRASISLRDPG